jgi:hypothetical protein
VRLRGELGADTYGRGNFDAAARLLDEITSAEEFSTFLTLAAYRTLP